MNRTVERVLLAAVVLGLFVPGAVRLADPFETHEHSSSPTIDDSQPPAEMAYDAMMQTERHNYTVIYSTRLDGEWRSNAITRRVDNTHHRVTMERHIDEYYNVFQNRHTAWLLYTNASTKWSKVVGGGFSMWLRTGSAEYYDGPFWSEPVRHPQSNVTVVSKNRTTTVLRINNNTTISDILFGPDAQASRYNLNNLTLHIDRDEQTLRRAVFRGRKTVGNRSTSQKYVYRFTGWGETTVNRPQWVPYTLMEILNDLGEGGSHHSAERARATAQIDSLQVAL